LLAKALATGDGYRMINLPGSPHATHYPPGYPFLLSLLWRIAPDFPDNVVVFKFANAVLLAVASVGVYWFARSRLGMGAAGAAVIAAFGTASITMLQLAGLVLSEPLFVALLFAALIVIERCMDRGDVRLAVLAGALLGAMTMVRTIGVVAIAGAVLVLLLRRRHMAAIAVVATSALFSCHGNCGSARMPTKSRTSSWESTAATRPGSLRDTGAGEWRLVAMSWSTTWPAWGTR
jgi:hypothetical protein